MASVVWHPDTAFNPSGRETLEVRAPGGSMIYTFVPGVAQDVIPEHLAAIQNAIAAAATTQVVATPAQPGVITQGGTAGAATWTYTVVASNDQGDSPQSVARSTATGNATLTGVNFNTIPMPAVPAGSVDNWKVIRTVSGGTPASLGLIATVASTVTTVNDTGAAATAYAPAPTGTSTAVGATSMTDTVQAWTVNQWKGFTVTSGGSTMVIISNTATVLSGAALTLAWSPSQPATGAYTISANSFGAPVGPPEV